MKILGLTGGIGSGKSTVVKAFADCGVHWVDADNVAREVVEPGSPALAAIAAHFGDTILTPEGQLDRAALRAIVFREPEEREWLEHLLHPLIRTTLVEQLRSPGADYALPYVILVSPLLLETDQHHLADRVLVVDVPVERQIERTMARDNNPRDQVERIIAAQMPREQRLSRADDVVNNDQALSAVKDEVLRLHHRYLDLFTGKDGHC
ncbi:MAG: dephospho-CoA kinase [Marinobacter sp.]|nr:dephospho-CoA kinase [Marinobacter sp.]